MSDKSTNQSIELGTAHFFYLFSLLLHFLFAELTQILWKWRFYTQRYNAPVSDGLKSVVPCIIKDNKTISVLQLIYIDFTKPL